MKQYIEMINEEQLLNSEISKIINEHSLKTYKLAQLKKLCRKHTSKRAISQIDYYCKNIKSSIYNTLIRILLILWLVLSVYGISYRIIELIHRFT